VAGERRAPQEIRERALIGLARTLESMSDGSEDDAIKAYETFVKEFPKSEYQADAQSRIGILKSGHGQEFYAWFSKYPRPKIAEKLPRDQAGDDSDEESSLRDDMESALKGASKKKSADDAEDLTLPEGREGNEKTGQASETKDDGKTSAKPASDDGSDPKPTPPAEPQTQPE
jgi:hypothetical protein